MKITANECRFLPTDHLLSPYFGFQQLLRRIIECLLWNQNKELNEAKESWGELASLKVCHSYLPSFLSCINEGLKAWRLSLKPEVCKLFFRSGRSWQSRGPRFWWGSVFSRVDQRPAVFSWKNKSVFPLSSSQAIKAGRHCHIPYPDLRKNAEQPS